MLTFLRSLMAPPAALETPEERLNRILSEVLKATMYVRWDIIRSRRAGKWLSRRRGGGIEFDHLREFDATAGDTIASLSARKTMLTGGQKWVVRVNRPELQNTDWLLMDVAPTHIFGGLRESKLDLCARAGATALLSTQKSNDLAGFVAYADDHVVSYLPASPPCNILSEVVGTILEPPYAVGDGDSGLESALAVLPQAGANVTWISDCLNLTGRQRELLKDVADRHRLMAVVVQDWREQYLPEPRLSWLPYRLKVFDLKTNTRGTFNCTRSNRQKYTREFREHTERLRQFFQEAGISYAIVQTEHEVEQAAYETEEKRQQAIARQRMEAIHEILALLTNP